MVRRQKGTDPHLVVKLTPTQKALIQECTGRVLESLDLDGCQDRLIVEHLRGAKDVSGASQYLILELTSKQRERLRKLTGKTFSEIKVQRRST